MEKLFSKRDLESLFEKLKSQGEIFAPVQENKLISLRQVSNLSEHLNPDDYVNTVKPTKEFFFAQREVEYSFEREAGKAKIKKRVEREKKRALWGIRPCEAASLLILDKVYVASDYVESRYKVLRDNTILIGFSCLKAGENCFCKYMNGSPFSLEGLDILVTKIGPEEFYVEGISATGQNLISSMGTGLKEAKGKRDELEKEAHQSFRREFKVPENLPELFENTYWEQVSGKCISCGICRYLCPTCHCFDLGMEESERVKYWDACAFKRFTQEASGVNPRWRKVDRYKQWVYHKYDYFKKRQGVHLCVGCGRCSVHCPTKMDIIDIFSGVPYE